MSEGYDYIIQLEKMIKSFKDNDFIDFLETHYSDIKIFDLTQLYKTACLCGNITIVDYLINTPLKFIIDIEFDYNEGNQYVESIPNGAIFLAGDNHNVELLKYFIKNDIYHIDSKTINGLELYMSSVLDIINDIELKLKLEEKLPQKSNLIKNIKI